MPDILTKGKEKSDERKVKLIMEIEINISITITIGIEFFIEQEMILLKNLKFLVMELYINDLSETIDHFLFSI